MLNNVAIVILAGGESKRMGEPKQLLKWGSTTLLGQAINQAKSSGIKDVYVVLGAFYDRIYKAHNGFDVAFIKNENWSTGLSSSIKSGLEHIISKKYNGVLFLLADQPQVNHEYIDELHSVFQKKHTIVATSYGNSIGIPVLFGSDYFNELLSLSNSKGAKSVIQNNKEFVTRVIPPLVIKDIDTPQEYLDFIK